MMQSIEAIELLKKSNETKTQSDYSNISKWMSEKFAVFKDLSEDVIQDIIKNSKLAQCSENSMIIKQGEIGLCFYILMTGQVSIYIQDIASQPDTNPNTLSIVPSNRKVSQSQSSISGNSTPPERRDSVDDEPVITFPKVTGDRAKFGNFSGNIDAVSGFGDKALLTDAPRAASIISNTSVLLLVLNRSVYNRSLRASHLSEFQTLSLFANNHPVFAYWPPRYKKQLAMSLTIQHYEYDKVIVRQNQPLDGMGFIVEGQAKTQIDIPQHTSQFPHLKISSVSVVDTNRMTPQSKHVSTSLQKINNIKRLEVSLCVPGEIIGDVEQIFKLPTYYRSIISIDKCTVYWLNQKNYDRLLSNNRRNVSTMEILQKQCEKKLLTQSNLRLYKQIPLHQLLVKQTREKKDLEASKVNNRRKPLQEQSINQAQRSSSISFMRGPQIDMFGPGTVFYRSKQIRARRKYGKKTLEKEEADKQKNNVNEPINDEPTKSKLGIQQNSKNEPKIIDQETSNASLNDLEKRVNQWHEDDNDNAVIGKTDTNITKLHRLDNSKPAKSGKTIILKPA